MKKSNGSLHFFINEQDQGEAVSNLPANVYGAVDIYGAAVKVSIISGTPVPVQEQVIGQSNSMYNYLNQSVHAFLKILENFLNFAKSCY